MTDKMPTEIVICPSGEQVWSTDKSTPELAYVLKHNNPDYYVIPKSDVQVEFLSEDVKKQIISKLLKDEVEAAKAHAYERTHFSFNKAQGIIEYWVNRIFKELKYSNTLIAHHKPVDFIDSIIKVLKNVLWQSTERYSCETIDEHNNLILELFEQEYQNVLIAQSDMVTIPRDVLEGMRDTKNPYDMENEPWHWGRYEKFLEGKNQMLDEILNYKKAGE